MKINNRVDFNYSDAIILTKKIIDQITPEHILYAEISEYGAMGTPGNAMVYLQSGPDEVIFCKASLFDENQQDAYHLFCKKMSQYVESCLILKESVGFGNYCFKEKTIKLARDDDDAAFIFKLKDKNYILKCSCRGPYPQAAAKFAKLPVDYEELASLLDNSKDSLDSYESSFMLAYIERRKDYDRGHTWLNKNALLWMAAVLFVDSKTKKTYLPQDILEDGNYATQYYKLDYLITEIGWNNVNDIMCEIIDKSVNEGKIQPGLVASSFAKALNQNFYDFFPSIETKNASIVDIDDYDFCDQFSKLNLIKFTKEQHKKIINDIHKMDISDLRACAGNVAHYFINYFFQDDELSYADLFPTLIHVLNKLPNDDFNHTYVEVTFSIAGYILTKILHLAPKSHLEYIQNEYFNVFWRRIGGLEMVKHYNEFEFKNDAQKNMFENSILFIAILGNIQDKNKKYYDYLCSCGKKIYESKPIDLVSDCQYQQSLAIFIQDIASKNDNNNHRKNAYIQSQLYFQKLKGELTRCQSNEQHCFNFFLETMCKYYPQDKNTTRILFEKIMPLGFAVEVITDYVLESNNPETITYALECIVSNIDKLYDSSIKNYGDSQKFLNMYRCTCSVASLEKHLTRIVKIKDFIASRENRNDDIINSPYNMAKKNVKKTIFQQKEIGKMQKYCFVNLNDID